MSVLKYLCLLVLYYVNIQKGISNALSCKDENGNDVDWFVASKLPQLKHSNPNVAAGTAYTFMGPNSSTWELGKRPISDAKSSISLTLAPLYINQTSKLPLYVLYNDEHPDGSITLIEGHTKGVVAFDTTTGFWLIHSVPKFPPTTNGSYSYPDSGEVYGQSFMCISLKFSSANQIGGLLLYDNPYIYEFQIADSIRDQVPLLVSAVKNNHVTGQPWNQSLILNSVADVSFQVFAKYKNFDKDIYSSWVAPFFQTDLLTETWQNGPGKLPSQCSSEFSVENVQSMTVLLVNATYTSTHDHSKLAISKQKDKPWICVGDINRANAQKRRGGGTVCLKHPDVWQAYYSMISEIESCLGNFHKPKLTWKKMITI